MNHFFVVAVKEESFLGRALDTDSSTLQQGTLYKSQDYSRLLIEQIQDALMVISPEGQYLDANQAACKMLGYEYHELLGKGIFDVTPLEFADKVRNNFVELKNNKTFLREVVKVRKDKTLFSAEINVSLMPDGNYISIMRDISHRIKMEEAIRKSEEEKDLILSSISEVVLYHDFNLCVKWANNAAMESCGMAIEDMLGKHCYEIWPGRSTPCEYCPVVKSLRTGKILKNEIVAPNGTIWSVQAYPVKDQDGNVIGAVEIAKDKTRSKEIEKEMARLERLNLIGEMAASFGHEIRNPMSTVRGFLQMLSGKPECASFEDYYKLMIEELDRANSIICEYLSLAKDKAVELKIYNINFIIESLFPLVLADALHLNKSIELKLSEVSDILIDKKEIHQLILNLVRNGLEAMTEGSILTLTTYRDGEDTVLAVQDQGSGIDPIILSKLGIPFVTTKENGTGLGLAVCYSIAERHNAKIEIETSSQGTTISVRFKKPVVF